MKTLAKALSILLIASLSSCVIALGNDVEARDSKTQQEIDEIVNNAEMMQCCKDAALLDKECESCTQ
jgi:hypothetical protein